MGVSGKTKAAGDANTRRICGGAWELETPNMGGTKLADFGGDVPLIERINKARKNIICPSLKHGEEKKLPKRQLPQ